MPRGPINSMPLMHKAERIPPVRPMSESLNKNIELPVFKMVGYGYSKTGVKQLVRNSIDDMFVVPDVDINIITEVTQENLSTASLTSGRVWISKDDKTIKLNPPRGVIIRINDAINGHKRRAERDKKNYAYPDPRSVYLIEVSV